MSPPAKRPKTKWIQERERMRLEIVRLETELRRSRSAFEAVQYAIDVAGVRGQLHAAVQKMVDDLVKELRMQTPAPSADKGEK